MECKASIRWLIFTHCLIALLALLFPLGEAQGQGHAPSRWERQAEESFNLVPGMGRRLMSEQEWKEYQQKMQGIDPADRERYRAEWYEKMVERARERAIKTPEMLESHPARGWD